MDYTINMQPDRPNNQIPAPPKRVVDVISTARQAPIQPRAPQPTPTTTPQPQESTKAKKPSPQADESIPSKPKSKSTPALAIFFALLIAVGLIALVVYIKLNSQSTTPEVL